jgi:hypothetical protein
MMSELPGIDRVRIQVGNRVVEMPLATSLKLRGRLLAARLEDVEDQFAEAGASRPVILDRADIGAVERVVAHWFTEVRLDDAPEGLVALEEALRLSPARGDR